MGRKIRAVWRRLENPINALPFLLFVISTTLQLLQFVPERPEFALLPQSALLNTAQVINVGILIISIITGGHALSFLYGNSQAAPPKVFGMPVKVYVLLTIFVSVSALVSGFAICYFNISTTDSAAFNRPINSPVMAFYFSLVTFATVGFGDISPTEDYTRLLVSIEIIFSMVYTIGIFSLIASFLRDNLRSPVLQNQSRRRKRSK